MSQVTVAAGQAGLVPGAVPGAGQTVGRERPGDVCDWRE